VFWNSTTARMRRTDFNSRRSLQATPTAAQFITMEQNGQVRGFAKEGCLALVTGGTFSSILPTIAEGSKGDFTAIDSTMRWVCVYRHPTADFGR
jgi:hypothetical protein